MRLHTAKVNIKQRGATAVLPAAKPALQTQNRTCGNGVTIRKTYALAGQSIATRVCGSSSEPNGLFYLHSYHLGSVSAVSNSSGGLVSARKYTPFGEWRGTAPGNDTTNRGYTNHAHNNFGAFADPGNLGLIYMNARYYVSGIGRFASADTIVPDPASPQAFNKYAPPRYPLWCGLPP